MLSFQLYLLMAWYSIYVAHFQCIYIQMRFTTLCGGLFARLLDGAVHNLNQTSRIHRYPLEQNE